MIDIQNQIYVVIQSFFLGCFLEIVYEAHSSVALLFNLRNARIRLKFITERLRKKDRSNGLFVAIWDIIYFLLILPLCAIFLYATNYGILRWYLLTSSLIGFILIRITFGRAVNFLLEFITCMLKICILTRLKSCIVKVLSKMKRKTVKSEAPRKRQVLLSINRKQGF